ncbi:phage baseplate upper protein [Enterococcus faecalis]|nr:phage baseplate upper protein [Enterococcus faecalis]
MSKWQATLSTTEPYNYVGIINVRQGNKNTEKLEVNIVENALPLDLTNCKVFFESVISNKYPIQRPATVVDARSGIIQYTFDEYSMQSLHRQEAYFTIYNGEELIGSTQNFSYFVIKAASKTKGEMGSYWQSIEDLIADMTAFINENKGDFTAWMNARKEEFEKWRKNQQDTFEAWRNGQESDYLMWFESIKDILKTVDPGGTMLAELMDARVDIQGVRHNSLSERLLADMDYLYQKLEKRLYTLEYGEINDLVILQDDAFSRNHETEIVGTVDYPVTDGTLVIATVDDAKQNTYMFEKVGEIRG